MFYLGSQRLIYRTDKYVVVNNVGPTKWRHLARHMNLTELEIDCIDYDYDKYGLREKVLYISSHHNYNYIYILPGCLGLETTQRCFSFCTVLDPHVYSTV